MSSYTLSYSGYSSVSTNRIAMFLSPLGWECGISLFDTSIPRRQCSEHRRSKFHLTVISQNLLHDTEENEHVKVTALLIRDSNQASPCWKSLMVP